MRAPPRPPEAPVPVLCAVLQLLGAALPLVTQSGSFFRGWASNHFTWMCLEMWVPGSSCPLPLLPPQPTAPGDWGISFTWSTPQHPESGGLLEWAPCGAPSSPSPCPFPRSLPWGRFRKCLLASAQQPQGLLLGTQTKLSLLWAQACLRRWAWPGFLLSFYLGFSPATGLSPACSTEAAAIQIKGGPGSFTALSRPPLDSPTQFLSEPRSGGQYLLVRY